MIGGLLIEYLPDQRALTAILAAIQDEGYTLRGIKAAPGQGVEKMMLCLDLDGYRDREQLDALAKRLLVASVATAVIHLAERCR
jgi:mannose/cellobiose epimerase-like protein (N-acyl-D-glucosamine 2-epimerase family)